MSDNSLTRTCNIKALTIVSAAVAARDGWDDGSNDKLLPWNKNDNTGNGDTSAAVSKTPTLLLLLGTTFLIAVAL